MSGGPLLADVFRVLGVSADLGGVVGHWVLDNRVEVPGRVRLVSHLRSGLAHFGENLDDTATAGVLPTYWKGDRRGARLHSADQAILLTDVVQELLDLTLLGLLLNHPLQLLLALCLPPFKTSLRSYRSSCDGGVSQCSSVHPDPVQGTWQGSRLSRYQEKGASGRVLD